MLGNYVLLYMLVEKNSIIIHGHAILDDVVIPAWPMNLIIHELPGTTWAYLPFAPTV